MADPKPFVVSRRVVAATLLSAPLGWALGRTPVGGTLRFTLPFLARELDPHVADDPFVALFGPALADPLFSLDGEGRPYPALAADLPLDTADGARITLRRNLTSARGKSLDARDAVFSLQRSRRLGGAAVLGELVLPRVDPRDPLSFFLPGTTAGAAAIALASPLTALVPKTFSPRLPDGTGAFLATLEAGRVVLTRNLRAARGAAFLSRIEIAQALDLASALRAFETGAADVGFLGAGLHRPRQGAAPFEGPEYGFLVLRSGRDAKSWGAPGVAQGLVDRVPAGALRHLGVRDVGGAARAGTGWGGGPTELLVQEDAPLFRQIAEVLAPHLTGSGPAIGVRPLPRRELVERRASGAYTLLVDFVRNAGPKGRATMLSLLAAASPDLAARPPRAASFEPKDVARTLPLGVVGALQFSGARTPAVVGLESFQLGGVSLEQRSV